MWKIYTQAIFNLLVMRPLRACKPLVDGSPYVPGPLSFPTFLLGMGIVLYFSINGLLFELLGLAIAIWMLICRVNNVARIDPYIWLGWSLTALVWECYRAFGVHFSGDLQTFSAAFWGIRTIPSQDIAYIFLSVLPCCVWGIGALTVKMVTLFRKNLNVELMALTPSAHARARLLHVRHRFSK